MKIKNHIEKSLATLALTGTLFFTGCQIPLAWDEYYVRQEPISQRLEQRLTEQEFEKNEERDKYALLFSGDTNSRYRYDLELVYGILLQEGFKEDKIFVLDDDGHQDGQPTEKKYPVDGAATRENIIKTLNKIEKGLDDNDLFFLYVADHGSRENNESNIRLPYSENLKESELEDYLKSFDPQIGILVFSQCYSGGFADRLGKRKFIAISSCDKTSVAWMGFFVDAFWGGYINGKNDLNTDGVTTIGEAYDYAIKNGAKGNLIFSQTPKLVSELDFAKDKTLK